MRSPSKASKPFAPRDLAVAAILDGYPKPIGPTLQALRELILDTARATEGVGALDETLKWGQVSYLASETGAGSTIRIDRVKSSDNQVAVFFHCQTNLVETFRALYPELSCSGNRAILLDAGQPLPKAELSHCVALALTYHLNKRKGGK
jgi:Domain of unknown function (DU1801)